MDSAFIHEILVCGISVWEAEFEPRPCIGLSETASELHHKHCLLLKLICIMGLLDWSSNFFGFYFSVLYFC